MTALRCIAPTRLGTTPPMNAFQIRDDPPHWIANPTCITFDRWRYAGLAYWFRVRTVGTPGEENR